MDVNLNNIYYNPSNAAGFSGLDKLVKEAGGKYTIKEIKQWLSSQDTYTLHKTVRKRFPRNRYVVYTINELWQADLNDMRGLHSFNNGNNYILTVVDAFSKRAFARPLKKKTGDEVIDAFQSIFDEASSKPKCIQTDKGSEFNSKKVRQFFSNCGVKYFTTKNPDTKAALVEIFNKSLKRRMWRYLTYANTYTYVDVLNDLVSAYNESVHRSIKMRPIDVNKRNSSKVWMNLYRKVDPVKPPKLNVGDKVRISKQKGTFEKGYETNWSEEIFRINGVLPFPQPLYSLTDLNQDTIDGYFYEYELQKVEVYKNRTFKIDKILASKGRGNSRMVLVKWSGYNDTFNSWIPALEVKVT